VGNVQPLFECVADVYTMVDEKNTLQLRFSLGVTSSARSVYALEAGLIGILRHSRKCLDCDLGVSSKCLSWTSLRLGRSASGLWWSARDRSVLINWNWSVIESTAPGLRLCVSGEGCRIRVASIWTSLMDRGPVTPSTTLHRSSIHDDRASTV
jgi:hypothetical protein